MSTQARLLKWRRVVQGMGGRVERVEQNKHIKMYLRFGKREVVMPIACSPSNWIADVRKLAWLRRQLARKETSC